MPRNRLGATTAMKRTARNTLLAATVALLAACGTQTSPGSAMSPVTAGVASNLAVDIDYTTVRSSRVLAAQIRQVAETLVDPILQNGGHLEVALFAEAGVAPVYLINQDVPARADLSGVRRDNYLIAARKNIGDLLDEAFGMAPVPASSPLAAQLAAMPGNGSDVAGMIRTSVADLQGRGGGAVVGLGDGLQRSTGVDFAADLTRVSSTTTAGMVAALMPTDASGVSITLRGVGNAGTGTTTTLRSIQAVATWTLACERTKAARCAVSPTL